MHLQQKHQKMFQWPILWEEKSSHGAFETAQSPSISRGYRQSACVKFRLEFSQFHSKDQ